MGYGNSSLNANAHTPCLYTDHKNPDVNEDAALVKPFEHVVFVLDLASVDLVEQLQQQHLNVNYAVHAEEVKQ